jgi:hypothetical protein
VIFIETTVHDQCTHCQDFSLNRCQRVIAFITEPGVIREILTHLGDPLEPPPVSPARGPPTDWGEFVQIHDDRETVQLSPDELPVIDIHSL